MVGGWNGFWSLVRQEARLLVTVNRSDRPWQMPFAAAMAIGLPLFVGVWFGHLEYGLVSSLGGLTFVYLPPTTLSHRMVVLMAVAFAMTACYTLGLISHFVPMLMMGALTLIAIGVTMLCRYYRVGVPGSMFFVMAAAIAASTPVQVVDVPLMVGLMFMGCLLAWLVALVYSLDALRRRRALPNPPLARAEFGFVVVDSVVIGLCVGLSLAVAQILGLEKAYWVPISCLAVIQGASLRAVWTKQIHRILGTILGLALAWVLLSVPMRPVHIALSMTVLAFIIETAVVRHYAFAAIFITPLTLLLAEAGAMGHASPTVLMQARLFDTILGSVIGFAGGLCLHRPACRDVITKGLWALVPSRFKTPANVNTMGADDGA